MAELLIRLSRKDPKQKNKLILYLRVAIFSVNFLVLVTMIIESIIFVHVMNGFYASCPSPWTESSCNLNGFVHFMKKLGWISGTYYTILTFCLIGTYVVLN
jgi:hypothetical protein